MSWKGDIIDPSIQNILESLCTLIDKSFLPELHDIGNITAKKNIVLRHVLSLAQELGLECIVEGIETEAHIQLLKDNECDLAQGFYFDKPLPCKIFETKL